MIDTVQCGAFLTALRKERQMTQKQLAERIGVTDKAISRWETGKGLPDAASMLALSDCFGITINELLRGKRQETPPTAQETDHTLVTVLQIADREKSKGRRRLSACIAMLAAFVLTAFLVCGVLVFNDLDGNGPSISSVCYTVCARRTARYIQNGQYKHAARRIGFINQNRSVSEEKWAKGMHDLFEEPLTITAFSVPFLTEDDQFISDYARLEVYDATVGATFSFIVGVNVQDGIAFAGVKAVDTPLKEHGEALAERIAKVLSTYNPG